VRLKEFSLSAPSGERPSPRTVAHRFGLETRCVTALFERSFPKFTDSRGWKVLVYCVPEVLDPTVRNLLGVLTIQQQFDVAGFLASDAREKKRSTLAALWSGIVTIARLEGWPLSPFEAARDEVLKLDYTNRWSWPKRPVVDRTSGLRAQLQCEHEVDEFRGWLVVSDKDGAERLRELVLQKPPSEFQFVPCLGRLHWEGGEVVLTSRNDAAVARVLVPAQAASVGGGAPLRAAAASGGPRTPGAGHGPGRSRKKGGAVP